MNFQSSQQVVPASGAVREGALPIRHHLTPGLELELAPSGACCQWLLLNEYLNSLRKHQQLLAQGNTSRAMARPQHEIVSPTNAMLKSKPLIEQGHFEGSTPRLQPSIKIESPISGLCDSRAPEVIDLSCASKSGNLFDNDQPVKSDLKSEKQEKDSRTMEEVNGSQSQSQTMERSAAAKRTKKKLDEQSDARSRRVRTMFSDWQLGELEWRFSRNKYLITSDRIRIAKLLNLDQLQVKTWFQNRRMKWKKQILASGNGAKSPTKPKGRPKRDSIPPMDDHDHDGCLAE